MGEEIYSQIFGNFDQDLRKELQILENMMKNDKDISMKTEMKTPYEFTLLESYVEYLRAKYWKKGKPKKFFILITVLDRFIEKYRPNMVSYNRKSRDETTKVLTARMEDKNTSRSTWDKMLGRGEPNKK